MKTHLLTALAAIALIASTFAPAQANIKRIAVSNETDTCAVVTIWESVEHGPWVEITGSGPRTLRPRMDIDPPTSANSKRIVTAVRVRAEMKQNADCTGKTVSDLDQPWHSDISGSEHFEAVLLGTKGGYRIKY